MAVQYRIQAGNPRIERFQKLRPIRHIGVQQQGTLTGQRGIKFVQNTLDAEARRRSRQQREHRRKRFFDSEHGVGRTLLLLDPEGWQHAVQHLYDLPQSGSIIQKRSHKRADTVRHDIDTAIAQRS